MAMVLICVDHVDGPQCRAHHRELEAAGFGDNTKIKYIGSWRQRRRARALGEPTFIRKRLGPVDYGWSQREDGTCDTPASLLTLSAKFLPLRTRVRDR